MDSFITNHIFKFYRLSGECTTCCDPMTCISQITDINWQILYKTIAFHLNLSGVNLGFPWLECQHLKRYQPIIPPNYPEN